MEAEALRERCTVPDCRTVARWLRAEQRRARDRRPLAVWDKRERSRLGGGPRRRALALRDEMEEKLGIEISGILDEGTLHEYLFKAF